MRKYVDITQSTGNRWIFFLLLLLSLSFFHIQVTVKSQVLSARRILSKARGKREKKRSASNKKTILLTHDTSDSSCIHATQYIRHFYYDQWFHRCHCCYQSRDHLAYLLYLLPLVCSLSFFFSSPLLAHLTTGSLLIRLPFIRFLLSSSSSSLSSSSSYFSAHFILAYTLIFNTFSAIHPTVTTLVIATTLLLQL